MTPEEYIIRANVVMFVSGFAYMTLLRNHVHFSFLRLWIVSGILLSLIAPFVDQLIPSSATQILPDITTETIIISPEIQASETSQLSDIAKILHYAFLLISAIFLIRFIYGITRLIIFIRKMNGMRIGGFRIFHLPENRQPFSFFRMIFLPQNLTYSVISLHEEQHAKMYHTIDLLLSEITSAVFWGNPFYWMLNKELRIVHEYQADRAVLNHGANMKEYQQILLSVTLGDLSGLPVNHLKQSFIKKRIIMMKKNNSFRLSAFRLTLSVPMLAAALWLASCGSKNNSAEKMNNDSTQKEIQQSTGQTDEPVTKEVFQEAEEMPVFPGGNEAMSEFFVKNVKYPQNAKEKGAQGTVYINFIIDEKGTVTNASVKQSVSPELDAEALRVVNLMPDWQPAQTDNKAVSVSMTIPVKFKLQ